MREILLDSLKEINRILKTDVKKFKNLKLEKNAIKSLKKIVSLGPNIKSYLHQLKLQGEIKTKQNKEKLILKIEIDKTNIEIKELEEEIRDFEKESAEYQKEKSHSKKEQNEYAKCEKEYNANKKKLIDKQTKLSSLKDMLEKLKIKEQE